MRSPWQTQAKEKREGLPIGAFVRGGVRGAGASGGCSQPLRAGFLRSPGRAQPPGRSPRRWRSISAWAVALLSRSCSCWSTHRPTAWSGGGRAQTASAGLPAPREAHEGRLAAPQRSGHGPRQHRSRPGRPSGVFVLETKSVNGDASVHRGVLAVRWREDLSRRVQGSPRRRHRQTAVFAGRPAPRGLRPRAPCGSAVWSCSGEGFEQCSILSAEVPGVRGTCSPRCSSIARGF